MGRGLGLRLVSLSVIKPVFPLKNLAAPVTCLGLISLLLFPCHTVLAGPLQLAWERSMQDAEQAFELKDYMTARRLFCQSIAQAEQCRQQAKLALRLKWLAGQYAAQKHYRIAAALRKQAEKIYSRQDTTAVVTDNFVP